MRSLIAETRRVLMNTPDTVCLERAYLATEAYRRFEGEPAPLLRARTLTYILENMTLDLDTNPVFAGNTSTRPRAWMLLPEYGFRVPDQAIVENPKLENLLSGDAIPAELRAFWEGRSLAAGSAAIGHLAVDMKRILSEGLEGVLAEAAGYSSEDTEGTNFRKACIIACQGIISWAQRYSEAAQKTAETCSSEEKRKALSRVAEACKRVPEKPPRNLFEALQSIVLVHLAVHIEGHGYSVAPGLLDRLLFPFYQNEPDIVELLAAFLLKLTANSLWGSHSKTQTITLGGLDAAGQDQCNPLTLHFLDACEMIRVPDPQLFLRWHRNISPTVKRRAMEMLASGVSMPMLVGDEQTPQGFINAGIKPEDAWDYCVIGCNELGIPAKLCDSASGPGFNYIDLLNQVLLELESPDSVETIDNLLLMLRERIKGKLTPNIMKWMSWRLSVVPERMPTPFTSALMDGCLKRGKDLQAEMSYPFLGIVERGFVNAVNALAGIEHTVFVEKSLSLSQIIKAMREDFADESVRMKLIQSPRWGNDDDRTDKWASAVLEMRNEVLREIEQETGCRKLVPHHVVRSLHHIDGKQIIGSPDGRYAHTPVADSVGAPGGYSPKGPTAMLRSVMKLKPARWWPGGYNLNLTLPAASAENTENLVAMADAFFSNGGQELQISCLDPGVLIDARDNPRNYPTLLVRIAGFCALFANLSPIEQEEMIQRALNAEILMLNK